MPKEHLDKLKKRCANDIKKAFIYKCSLEEWLKENEEWLKDLEETYTEEEKKNDPMYKMEVKMFKESGTKEYYEKTRGRYVKDLEILQNPKSTKKQLFKVFNRHDLSFHLNKDGTDGSYLLAHLGWCDNYRINSYEGVTHHNAKEAIEWLENYDNGHNISFNGKKGMCQEIKDLLIEFFKGFPNGTIHYG